MIEFAPQGHVGEVAIELFSGDLFSPDRLGVSRQVVEEDSAGETVLGRNNEDDEQPYPEYAQKYLECLSHLHWDNVCNEGSAGYPPIPSVALLGIFFLSCVSNRAAVPDVMTEA